MERSVSNNRMIWADIISIIIIAICAFIAALFFTSPQSGYDLGSDRVDKGWYFENGDSADISNLPKGDVTISHSLEKIDTNGKSICFKSTDTHIEILADGVSIYNYAPEYANLLGKSYGMFVHLVLIPSNTKEITLKLHPIYNKSAARINYAVIERGATFMNSVYRRGLPNFALCSLMVVFGILMLLIGFIDRSNINNNTLNFFSLGSFAILVGVWSLNDTMIIQAFTGHPEIMHFINYLCLIFVSYLPVSFMASASEHKGTILLPVLLWLITINFVVTMAITVLGIRDMYEMLPLSHINILIALCMTIYLMWRAVKNQKIEKGFLRAIIIGMSSAVIGVTIDMIRYRLFPYSELGSSMFTRVGVLVFIIMVGFYLMRRRTRMAVERAQSETMRKMAYTDGLTGLSNRAAFHEKESDIRKKKKACCIIQFDINFLKKVNDVYGHAEGDRHIIGAAEIISKSFGSHGTCYRTGGDEFVSVTKKPDTSEVEKGLKELNKLVEQYNEKENPPVAMQIACGYAIYPAEAETIDAAEVLADKRMYENKRKMKEENA